MSGFFSSAFQGLASLFAPASPPAPVAPPSSASRTSAASSTAAPATVAAPAPPPADPAVGFWRGVFAAAISVALTKPGQGRRTDALRRVIGGSIGGALALGLLFGAGSATPARAEGPICADRAKVVERLREKYGESREAVGLLQDQRVVEVWRSEKTGSWTIVVTLPSGATCLLAAGDNWEEVNEPAPVAGRGI